MDNEITVEYVEKYFNDYNCYKILSSNISTDIKQSLKMEPWIEFSKKSSTKSIFKCACGRHCFTYDQLLKHNENNKHHVSYKKDKRRESSPNGYFYVLQLREHIRLKENVYKIGRTKRDIFKRFKEYPKGSVMLYTTQVDDCVQFENNIKQLFKNVFVHRSDCGAEYFEGNLTKMINEVNRLMVKDYAKAN